MKQALQQLIAQGKTGRAIQQLLAITGRLEDTDLQEEVILQSARYEQYTKSKRTGISSSQDQGVSIANINQALLSIISQLPEDTSGGENDEHTANSKGKTKGSAWWQWVVGASVIVAILAGVAEVSGYSLKDLFSKGKVNSFSVTVLVHGKEGKDDRILRNQGKVALDFGTTREEESINEKGEATFKELPIGYVGKKALISIDHPQPYFPVNRDTAYILEKGKSIYLEAELKGMDKVHGRVLDYETETPLDSVRVSYQDIAAYTDEYGWYELNIPPSKQGKFIRLNFYKDGYKMEDLDSIAPHTQQEYGILLERK
ncbi:hypothetical protein [Phaeodactylibacter xiamenensis]|uniref:hypothetical protein n=1 Tax=Phaeodactylibacter xiamenensis TaxID=1524460 RepID=UPI0024A82529|nr:hypothetical protein [Phaeodactylibacter xiamenensis]